MMGRLRRINRVANRHAGKVLLTGLLGVAWLNWQLWGRDRARLAELAAPEPLPPLAAWPRLPKASLLVAAWNEAAYVERHIQSVLALRYPNKELVLCAGGDDGTYRLAERWSGPGVRVIEQRPGEGKQRALRRCLELADGEIVFLTDADCLPDDESFERTLAPLLAGEAEAATGGSRPLPEQLGPGNERILVTYRSAVDAYVAGHAPAESTGLLGRNAAMTRGALERAGALRAEVPSGTDYHLAKSLLRVGVRIRQVRDSEMPTHYAEGLRAYARQQRRWLRNVARLGRQFGAYPEVQQSLRTSFIGLGMLGSVAGWPVAPWLAAPWLILVAHGAAGKLRYLAFAAALRGRRDGHVPALLGYAPWAVTLTLVEFVAWSAPFLDYVRSRKKVTW
ncbi:MAG TPA: glycosyltransferase [Chloroflexota bacterium]|nr:glycosyltransferase [Chloroflexota bacterium]